MGLDLLRDFVIANQGCLDVYSVDGWSRVEGKQTFGRIKAIFPGTVFNISLRCDEKKYMLASAATGPLCFKPMREDAMRIQVRELLGPSCISFDEGQALFSLLHPALLRGESIEVDFSGVGIFTSAFFNAAIGQLLRDQAPETLNHLLKISALQPTGEEVLRRVIENSRQYYGDPAIRKAVDEAISNHARETCNG